jgi:hypothetical protein
MRDVTWASSCVVVVIRLYATVCSTLEHCGRRPAACRGPMPRRTAAGPCARAAPARGKSRARPRSSQHGAPRSADVRGGRGARGRGRSGEHGARSALAAGFVPLVKILLK